MSDEPEQPDDVSDVLGRIGRIREPRDLGPAHCPKCGGQQTVTYLDAWNQGDYHCDACGRIERHRKWVERGEGDSLGPNTLASRSAGKHPFLVCYDYGTGGVWAYILAERESDIPRRFPDLRVVRHRPEWMSEAEAERIAVEMTLDIDDTMSDFLNALRGAGEP